VVPVMAHFCVYCYSLLYFAINISFLQLSAVHLVDSHLCSDPGKYVSALLLSLTTMLHLELPHVNVLSKIDLIESYGKLGMDFSSISTQFYPFQHFCLDVLILACNPLFFYTAYNLEFYTDVEDLSYLQYHLDQDPLSSKYRCFFWPFYISFWGIFGIVCTLLFLYYRIWSSICVPIIMFIWLWFANFWFNHVSLFCLWLHWCFDGLNLENVHSFPVTYITCLLWGLVIVHAKYVWKYFSI